MRIRFANSFLTLTMVLSTIMASTLPCFAANCDFSAQAISNFKANGINAEIAMVDQKYDHPISKSDLAEILVKLHQQIFKSSTAEFEKPNPFLDTHSKTDLQAYSMGYLNGKSRTQFDPNGTVTRQEFAVILVRFLNKHGIVLKQKGDLKKFTDYKKISPWALKSIEYCVGNRLINGRNHGTNLIMKDFDPTGSISTEEVITVLDKCAILYGWYKPSPYKYFGGFYIPNEMKYTVSVWVTEDNKIITSINGWWSDTPDVIKLRKDMIEILKLNYGEKESYEDVVAYLLPSKDQAPEYKYFQLKNGKVQCIRNCDRYSLILYK